MIAPLAALAMSDARCARGDVHEAADLRRIRRNDCLEDSALLAIAFRRLVLQIGGANIAGANRTWHPP